MMDRLMARGALLGPALLVAAPLAFAAPGDEALDALRAADDRAQALNRLAQAAYRLEGPLGGGYGLRSDADTLRQAKASLPEASARAAEAAAGLAGCTGELRAAREHLQFAAARTVGAHGTLRTAVAALSAAPRAEWPRQLKASDKASAALRQAIGALEQAAASATGASAACGDRIATARFANLRRLLKGAVRSNAASLWRSARESVEAARAQAAVPVSALAPLPDRPPPDPGALVRIVDSLEGPSDGEVQRAATGFAAFPQHVQTLRAAVERIGRLSDAITYIDTAEPDAKAPCAAPRCSAMALERQRLAADLAQAQAALRAWNTDGDRLIAALDADVAMVRAAQLSLESRRASLEAGIDEVLMAFDAWLPEAVAAVPAYIASVEREHRAAMDAFSARYTAVHGTPPPPSAPALAHGRPPPPQAAPAPPAFPSAHAHTTVRELGGEPAGFGAYTYVIVRSARTKDDEAVRRRLARVIATLSATVRASGVQADLRRATNLFCISSSASEWEDPRKIFEGFDDDLSKQILARLQAGVFASHGKAAPLQERVTRGNGPFLLTLPGRAGESDSLTPVLLADLSRYDDAAIADVVNAYMSGLVERFPEEKELWKPPLKVQVALSIVRWATGPGRVVENMVSSAAAAPAR